MGEESQGENFTWEGLDQQTALQSNCQNFASSLIYFNIKLADEDKAGGGDWGRREGKGQGRAGQVAPQ
jgi:hypothetical protein